MSVLIITPAYGGMITAPHFVSCLRLKDKLQQEGLDHEWSIGWNESLVHRARMEMSAQYLRETDFKYMMWIDADIEFSVDDFGKLWNLDADIATGVYAMKKHDQQWFAAWKDGALVKNLDQFEGPIEVDYAGTGFMLIKREVIVTLSAHAEQYEGPKGPVPALYMTPIHNGCLESEDYFFCRKAREAGYKVMMDPSVRLGHWGMYRYGS